MVGFFQDESGDWVARLACGHTQHVRHRPPFQNRPWVVSATGRARFMGKLLNCKLCDNMRIHVVAGALLNHAHHVLIAQRPVCAHQGGRWEFPGGKLEHDEAPRDALARELREELGVRILAATPLIQVAHDYPDRSVLLDVWQVTRWQGTPVGIEGQATRWVPVAELRAYEFPEADRPVLAKLAELNPR